MTLSFVLSASRMHVRSGQLHASRRVAPVRKISIGFYSFSKRGFRASAFGDASQRKGRPYHTTTSQADSSYGRGGVRPCSGDQPRCVLEPLSEVSVEETKV